MLPAPTRPPFFNSLLGVCHAGRGTALASSNRHPREFSMNTLQLTTALAALSAPALAEMPQVEPILSVTPVSGASSEVRICAGAPGGAYHSIASQMLGLVQSAAGVPVS